MISITIDMDKLAKDAYENSKAHGFWEDDRTIHEAMVLVHSEISEALEAFRDGKMDMYFLASGKPEGFPAEMADVVIRVADWFGKHGIPIGNVVGRAQMFARSPEASGNGEALYIKRTEKDPIMYWLNRFHGKVVKATEAHDTRKNPVTEFDTFTYLVLLLEDVFEFCFRYSVQIDRAIDVKHRYNISRTYKHGGKAA